MLPRAQPARVVVEDVRPRIDEGRTPIRRVPGEVVEVEADVFADGVLGVRATIRWQAAGDRTWHRVPMRPIGNDRWRGSFVVPRTGRFRYDVEGSTEAYLGWRSLLERRIEANSVTHLDLLEGVEILRSSARRLRGQARTRLLDLAREIEGSLERATPDAIRFARDSEIDALHASAPAPKETSRSPDSYPIVVDPEVAQHSAWYEVFPRSTSSAPARHGTFRDLSARLEYIADLGFDVVYLPPIHPIGRVHRRGPNNVVPAPPGSPGSPWAIGNAEGGHTSVHPDLGTLEEFRELVGSARDLGLEIALDLAFQCAPDHPWVAEHPSWFAHLPDGSIRPAENPPKKYDDIVPLDFETSDWAALWTALKEVVDFWISQGVRWFRVDNPHTKPFAFWEWLIGEVRKGHPEVMFLAEAFTRPKVMYRLAKAGFTHSYTYFAWRSQRDELTQYFREITSGEVGEYFRPHLWPNTPDILTDQFHRGQRSVYVQRLVLAGTLSPHYGIYGPAYELLVHEPLEPGKEEYRNSEKYEVRHWDLTRPESLAPEIRRLNRIRRAHPALRSSRNLHFHPTDNERLIAYSRRTDDRRDVVLIVVNLDPEWMQSGWVSLDLAELGLAADAAFDVHDLWSDEQYHWRGPRNFVQLVPSRSPVHVLAVERPPENPAPSTGGA
jgi:starch synthase (maltosyl-transferring)